MYTCALFVDDHAGAPDTAPPAPAVERSHTIEMLAQSSKANLASQPSFEIFAPINLRTPAKSEKRGKGQGTPPPGQQTPVPATPGQPTPTETESPARSLLTSPNKAGPTETTTSPTKTIPTKTSPTKTSPTKTSPTKTSLKKGFVPASSLQRSRRLQSVASQQPKLEGYWKCRCCIIYVYCPCAVMVQVRVRMHMHHIISPPLPRVRRYLKPEKGGELKCTKEVLDLANTKDGSFWPMIRTACRSYSIYRIRTN